MGLYQPLERDTQFKEDVKGLFGNVIENCGPKKNNMFGRSVFLGVFGLCFSF